MYEILGWYTVGTEATELDLRIQRQVTVLVVVRSTVYVMSLFNRDSRWRGLASLPVSHEALRGHHASVFSLSPS